MVQNASQKLELELFHAVKVGDALSLSAMLSQAHFSNAVISKALHEACATNDRMACIKALVPFINPKRENSFPLQTCARRGDLEAVRFLIPLSSPGVNQSQALRAAVSGGRLQVALELLPFGAPGDAVLAFSDGVKEWKIQTGVFKENSERIQKVLLHLLDHIQIQGLASWHLDNPGKSLDLARYDEFFACLLGKGIMGIGDLAPLFEQEALASQLPSLKVGWDAYCLDKQTHQAPGVAASRRL